MDLQALINGSQAMAENFVPLVAGGLSTLIGIYLVGAAVMAMVKMGDRGGGEESGKWGAVLAKLLIGAFLLQFASTMQTVSQTLFGTGIQDYHGALAYMPLPAQNTGFWKQVLEVCLLWVVMLGWIAALRGFLQWSKAANGSGNGQEGDYFWKGSWHIVGGACAINMTGLIQAFLGR